MGKETSSNATDEGNPLPALPALPDEAMDFLPDYESAIKRSLINGLYADINGLFDDRGLPHNSKLEQEALCAILLGDPKHTGIAFSLMESEDFHNPIHAAIFDGFRDAWEQGIPFDTPGTLVQWIADSGLIARLRQRTACDLNFDLLLELMQSNGLAIHAEYYARTLRRLRVKREIWLMLVDAVRDAKDCQPCEWLEKYGDKITELRTRCDDSDRSRQ